MDNFLQIAIFSIGLPNIKTMRAMCKRITSIFTISLLILIMKGISQENQEIKLGVNINTPKKWDTTCYISYSHKLNVYAGYSVLRYNLDIQSQFKHPYKYPTSINYTTYTPLNYSIGFSYDKISFGFSFAQRYSYDSTQSKPKTQYKAYSFSFGGNKFIIEPYYTKFKGFYDSNTPNNDTTFKIHKRYYANPSLEISSFKINSIYFLNNKKFAYRSLSGITYRQLQSKGSWLIIANVYYTRMHSDSMLYPSSVELAYDSVIKLNAFTIYGGNTGVGYGHIFAIGKKKRFFIGFTLAGMLGIQHKQVFFKDSISNNETKIAGGFDARFSIGWTTDKFFIVAFAYADRVSMKYEKLSFTPYTVPINFTLGWRFNIKPPKFYQAFMNTKLYQWL